MTFISMLAIAACVDDDKADVLPPGSSNDSGAREAGTSSGGTSGSGTSSGDLPDSGDVDSGDSGDAGPTGCAVNPTPFPCDATEPPNACYGDVQSCTLTGCGGANDLIWSCTVAKDCSRGGSTDGLVCCLSSTAATVTLGTGCTPGSLKIAANPGLGTSCSAGPTCADGASQLCGSDEDCPENQQCKPLTISEGGASINGNRVGVCAP